MKLPSFSSYETKKALAVHTVHRIVTEDAIIIGLVNTFLCDREEQEEFL